jgi:acetylornithine deacetylase/succinyl-diaminopimelate desuccinylase-like protein
MDQATLERFIDRCWDDEVVPRLVEYIRIPNKSPAFDPQWAAHGHMDAAVALFEGWARRQLGALAGATVEVVRLPGRTPLILIDIPGATRSVVPGATRSVVARDATRRADDCVLLYGHLDKQPEMTGWADGTGPWIPVLRDDKLYGRGGADDGYAMFGALSAILALREQKVPHARAVLLIEACEESGSYDLPHYVDHLAGRLGTPSLVVCLDSGCGNYDQLWMTTSLRGLVSGTLTVEVLTEGVHSGDASGIVPSSFRILRQLLSRLEDETTGAIHVAALHADIPADRRAQAERAAAALGDEIYTKFPLVPGLAPVATDPTELVLNRTWRPQLAVTGMAGLPAPGNAGNVLLPFTAAKLTLRLPPTLDGPRAVELVGKLLEADPPYGARIRFDGKESSTGWNAPALAPWLGRSLADAAEAAFHAPPAYMGEGGTIPFMAMLGEKFPHAQFVVTGVLGPQSNAHGPNEFLHIPTAKRLSAVIARVLADHHAKAA